MSSETAEQAIAQHPQPRGLRRSTRASARLGRGRGGLARRPRGARERAERATALRDVWRALWISRLLVWIGGIGAVAGFGFGPVRHALNPLGAHARLGCSGRPDGGAGRSLGRRLVSRDRPLRLSPAVRARWPPHATAFFPLYPLGLRLLSELEFGSRDRGVLLSVVVLAAGLYGLHRLTSIEVVRLDWGSTVWLGVWAGGTWATSTRLVVLLTAFAPMAFYFSAVYSESLYFALSVGVFLCARRGQWARAARFGRAGVRDQEYGDRVDGSARTPLPVRAAIRPRARSCRRRANPRGDDGRSLSRARRRRAARRSAGGLRHGLIANGVTPRYRVRSDALWLALAPLGLCLYMAHLALAGGDALAPFHAEAVWKRDFAGPYGGVWDRSEGRF